MGQKQRYSGSRVENINHPSFTKEKDLIEYLHGCRGQISRRNEIRIRKVIRRMNGRAAIEYAINTHNLDIAGKIFCRMLNNDSDKGLILKIRRRLTKLDGENANLYKDLLEAERPGWLKNLGIAMKRKDYDSVGHIISVALENIKAPKVP